MGLHSQSVVSRLFQDHQRGGIDIQGVPKPVGRTRPNKRILKPFFTVSTLAREVLFVQEVLRT